MLKHLFTSWCAANSSLFSKCIHTSAFKVVPLLKGHPVENSIYKTGLKSDSALDPFFNHIQRLKKHYYSREIHNIWLKIWNGGSAVCNNYQIKLTSKGRYWKMSSRHKSGKYAHSPQYLLAPLCNNCVALSFFLNNHSRFFRTFLGSLDSFSFLALRASAFASQSVFGLTETFIIFRVFFGAAPKFRRESAPSLLLTLASLLSCLLFFPSFFDWLIVGSI